MGVSAERLSEWDSHHKRGSQGAAVVRIMIAFKHAEGVPRNIHQHFPRAMPRAVREVIFPPELKKEN